MTVESTTPRGLKKITQGSGWKTEGDANIDLTDLSLDHPASLVPSASTLVLPNDGNYIRVTGIATITALDRSTNSASKFVHLRFDSALKISHNANSLILPGAIDINTIAGDVLSFFEISAGNWELLGSNVFGSGGAGLSVKRFGAVGDGITDDTTAIIATINAVNTAGGSIVYFPAGEYYITAQLPFFNNMEWRGEGRMQVTPLTFTATSITYNGTSRHYDVVVTAPNDDLSEWLSGDGILLAGFATSDHNARHEIISTNNATKTITILHSSLTTTGTETISASATVDRTRGGSLLRFRSLNGTVTDNVHFIDVSNLDYARLTDIGFMGAGANASGGGGIRFRRDSSNKALTGYRFNNVSMTLIPSDALIIEGPVVSQFDLIRISHCAGDAFTCKPSQYGGSTTSTEFNTIYVTSSKRGLVIDRGVYFTVTNCVFEGVSVAMFFKNCSAFTLNSPASETIKLKKDAGQQGVSFIFVGCYAWVMNGPAVFYNTETTGWAKAAVMAYRTPRHNQGGSIVGGRYHPSIDGRKKILATQQTTTVALVYIDKDFASLSTAYWKIGRQFVAFDMTTDLEFNERHQITGLAQMDILVQTGTHTNSASAPTVSDDSVAGHAVGDTWTDTTNAISYKNFGVAVGAAVWQAESAVTVATLDMRQSQTLPITLESATAEGTKIGRNFAVDIVTKNVFRVWESQQAGTVLTFWLDFQDRIPQRYLHTIDFGTGNTASNNDYTCTGHQVVDVAGTKFLKSTFRTNPALDAGFNWLGSLIQDPVPAGASVTVNTQGFAETFIPTKILWNQTNGEFEFYFAESQFLNIANQIEIYGSMLSDMDGKYATVNSQLWENSLVTKSAGTINMSAMKITVTSPNTKTYSRVEDWGIYSTPDASFDVESSMQIMGGNEIRVWDEQEVIGINTTRTGSVAFATGVGSITINGKDMDSYDWSAIGNGTSRVYVSAVTTTSVTFTRGSTTNAYSAIWSARRKKNIGWNFRASEAPWA